MTKRKVEESVQEELHMAEYQVEATFTEPILGSAPADPKVYTTYITAKKEEAAADAAVKAGLDAEEVALLPEQIENKGKTVFRRNKNKELILMDYQVKGFLKAAARAVTGTKVVGNLYHKISIWVWVFPRQIPILLDGKPITEVPDNSDNMRPLRAMTMQGPRVSLASSEEVPAGVTINFKIKVLPLGTKEINEKMIKSWLDYAEFGGISQWNSGGYGRFSYKIK